MALTTSEIGDCLLCVGVAVVRTLSISADSKPVTSGSASGGGDTMVILGCIVKFLVSGQIVAKSRAQISDNGYRDSINIQTNWNCIHIVHD